MWYVYIIRSLKKRWFYIGVTEDPEKRLLEHNSGSTKSTKPYRPFVLVHKEFFAIKEAAFKREWFLKHPIGYLEKKKIIDTLGEIA